MLQKVERAVFVILVPLVLWQAYAVSAQNRRLSKSLSEIAQRTAGQLTIQPGHRVPGIRGLDEDYRLREPLSRIFVAVTMNTRCAALLANAAQWTALSGHLRDQAIPLLWISADTVGETREFLKARGIVGPFLADVPHSVYSELRMSAVPQLLMVADGLVERTWDGVPDARMAADITAAARSRLAPKIHGGGQ